MISAGQHHPSYFQMPTREYQPFVPAHYHLQQQQGETAIAEAGPPTAPGGGQQLVAARRDFPTHLLHKSRVPQQVTANDLAAVIQRRNHLRLRPFIEVTNTCYRRLKRFADIGISACVYHVPGFLSGLPLYDVDECTDFLVCHLRLNGFRVRRDAATQLYIEWTPPQQGDTDDEQQQQNMIINNNKNTSGAAGVKKAGPVEMADDIIRSSSSKKKWRRQMPPSNNNNSVDTNIIPEVIPEVRLKQQPPAADSSFREEAARPAAVVSSPGGDSLLGTTPAAAKTSTMTQRHTRAGAKSQHQQPPNSVDALLFKSTNLLLKPSGRFSLVS